MRQPLTTTTTSNQPKPNQKNTNQPTYILGVRGPERLQKPGELRTRLLPARGVPHQRHLHLPRPPLHGALSGLGGRVCDEDAGVRPGRIQPNRSDDSTELVCHTWTYRRLPSIWSWSNARVFIASVASATMATARLMEGWCTRQSFFLLSLWWLMWGVWVDGKYFHT